MKRILFLFLILFSANIFAIKVNISASMQTAKYAETSNVWSLSQGDGAISYEDPIYAVNVEVVQELFSIGEIGAGATYEQGYKRTDGETFNAIPIYGIVRVAFSPLYLNVKYGTTIYSQVSDPNTTYKDAQYLSAGAGIEFDNSMKLEYSVNANTVKRNGIDMGSVSYGFTLGYSTF